jgi:hypothetical protein
MVYSALGLREDPQVPLKYVSIVANMIDNHGEVTVTQNYENTYDSPIEATYSFTLDENSVVTSFRMTIGAKTLVGKVVPRKNAKIIYETSKSGGKQTALLEKNGGIYETRIGNILPKEQVTITFSYLTTLNTDASGFKFVLPTNIAPHYVSPGAKPHSHYPSYSTSSNYDFSLRLGWQTASKFTNFTSPTNELTFLDDTETHKTVHCLTKPSSGDVVICVKTDAATVLYDYHDESNNDHYLMLARQVPDVDVDLTPKTYHFLLDRSGSMSGTKITQALDALKLFIRSIPEGSYFNVISFGSAHVALWKHCVPYNTHTIKQCIDTISTFGADMGGTEIYSCVATTLLDNYSQFQIKTKKVAPVDMENIVIMLTDGQIGDVPSVVNMVEKHNEKNGTKFRFFGVGVGRDASRELLSKVTLATYGTYKMIVEAKQTSDTVIELMECVTKQYFKNVSLKVGTFVSNSKAMYPSQYFSVCCKLSDTQYAHFCVDLAQISYVNALTNETVTESISHTIAQPGQSFFKKIYANERIKNLTDKYMLSTKSKIEKISTKYQIMNEFTSFVLSGETAVTTDESVTVTVPHYYEQSMERCAVPIMLCDAPAILCDDDLCDDDLCGDDLGVPRGMPISRTRKSVFKSKMSIGKKILSGIASFFGRNKDNISYPEPEKHCVIDSLKVCSPDSDHMSPPLKKSTGFDADEALKYNEPNGKFNYDSTNYNLVNCSDDAELQKCANAIGLDANIYFNLKLYKLFVDLNESKYKLIIGKLKKWLEKQTDFAKYVSIV